MTGSTLGFKEKALRHIKESAVAFYLTQWFEPAKWEAKEFKL